MKRPGLFREDKGGGHHALGYMHRVSHFEFGLDLGSINCSDGGKVREMQGLWEKGGDVRSWAQYWAMIYGHVADMLEQDPALREAAIVLRYEDLCEKPDETMRRMMEHCGLEIDEEVLARFAGRLKPPGYYRPDFTDAELTVIAKETASSGGHYGYP